MAEGIESHNGFRSPQRTRTVRDAVYGVAVGDALGLPAESRERDTYSIEDMVGGGVHGKPAGTYSDDTSLTLATCNSIRVTGGIDCEDMRQRFAAWVEVGAYVVDGKPFGIGATTNAALASGQGRHAFGDNGNGSLMRIIPLAFVPDVSDRQIEEVSAITHAHGIAKRACVIYVHFARNLLKRVLAGDDKAAFCVRDTSPEASADGLREDRFTPKGNAGILAATCAELPHEPPFERLADIASLKRADIRSTGYVVDTLEAALWCLVSTDTYAACVLKAVNLGDDADTVGAVAGGLAGILYGREGIPQRWIGALRGRGILEASLF